MIVPFTKMHGLGNDFIVVPWASPEPFPPPTTQHLCDRHFGIGADGILLLVPTPDADIQMIVLNADGSRPEMCGNGLRCAALHTAGALHRPPVSLPVRVLTDDGPRDCLVEYSSENTASVTALVGSFSAAAIHRLRIEDRPVELHVLSVGNPHGIVFTDDASMFDALAPAIANHPDFAKGINASFAHISAGNEVTLRVWERGVGPTLACGTAACATAAAAAAIGLVTPDKPITTHLPGGDLTVYLDLTAREVRMRGPATRVFEGTFDLR